MPKTYNLEFGGQQLELRADRSLWWPDQSVLFLADVHAGKTEHFQRAGLAVPSGSLTADLARLQTAIDELQPARVIVLGDLFHSDMNSELQTLAEWVGTQRCSIELVRGNHDRFIDDAIFIANGITVHAEGLQLEPFTLRHHPQDDPDGYVLCGHLHPVHTFGGPGADRLRLPCFVVQPHQLILPAFGSFTGGLHTAMSAGTLVGTAPDFSALVIARQR